jgi:hypothetical protein
MRFFNFVRNHNSELKERACLGVILSRCGISSGLCGKECATLEVTEHTGIEHRTCMGLKFNLIFLVYILIGANEFFFF